MRNFVIVMVKFSVITCTFNASEVVDRTLESVRLQSYPHIEHIIMDGVSRDDTMAKVNRYASSNNREHEIHAFSQPDNGLYDAMNKAIAEATGDYIIFLNAGDKFLDAETLASVASQIADGPFPGVIYGDTEIVDDNGKFLHKRRLAPPENLTWKSFRHGMMVCHQSFYALTTIAKTIPYDLGYRLSADVDWCIRIMKESEREGLRLHNTHQTLTSYLEGGLSVKNHRASLIERFRIMCRHYGLLSTIGMHLWFVLRALNKKKITCNS